MHDAAGKNFADGESMKPDSSDFASSETRATSEHRHLEGVASATPFPPDELAAPFFAKLAMLARFGLTSHTRLLLEARRQES